MSILHDAMSGAELILFGKHTTIGGVSGVGGGVMMIGGVMDGEVEAGGVYIEAKDEAIDEAIDSGEMASRC
jgi:hypothetical protein